MEKKIAEGTQRECFATEYLKIAEKENFDENQKFFTGIIPPLPVPQTQTTLPWGLHALLTYGYSCVLSRDPFFTSPAILGVWCLVRL